MRGFRNFWEALEKDEGCCFVGLLRGKGVVFELSLGGMVGFWVPGGWLRMSE